MSSIATKCGGVSDLDMVILNPEDSQHVKATYVHIWNTTNLSNALLSTFVFLGH